MFLFLLCTFWGNVGSTKKRCCTKTPTPKELLQNNKEMNTTRRRKLCKGAPGGKKWTEFYTHGLLHFLISRNLLFYCFFQFESCHLGILFLFCFIPAFGASLFFSLPTAGVRLRDLGKVGSASLALLVFRSSPALKIKTGFEKTTKENKTQHLCMSFVTLAFSWPLSLCMYITYLQDRWVTSTVTYKTNRRREEKNLRLLSDL